MLVDDVVPTVATTATGNRPAARSAHRRAAAATEHRRPRHPGHTRKEPRGAAGVGGAGGGAEGRGAAAGGRGCGSWGLGQRGGGEEEATQRKEKRSEAYKFF